MAAKSKEMYLEELEKIEPLTEEEFRTLLPIVHEGNQEALNRLVEGNLKKVVEAAAFYSHSHSKFMDLVQEGNIALLLKLQELPSYDKNTDEILETAIREAMEAYKAQENEAYKAGVELKTKLNVMDEVCVRLAEEFGREATAEEVAEKMQMDPEDVKYLMKIALSALQREE